MSFDAIILAGGGSTRMSGLDKAVEWVGSESMLQRALRAASGAERRIVVGPQRSLENGVVQIEEEDQRGPVAAISAALPYITQERVVVLACDMPFVGASDLERLLSALSDSDAVCGVDHEDRVQYLPLACASTPLRDVLEGSDVRDASLRWLTVQLGASYVSHGGSLVDCDTPEDLEAARRAVEGQDS